MIFNVSEDENEEGEMREDELREAMDAYQTTFEELGTPETGHKEGKKQLTHSFWSPEKGFSNKLT